MDNEQIKDTVEKFREDGVRVRDVAFVLLAKMFSDGKTAYQCLFGGTDGYEDYAADPLRKRLEEHMASKGYIRSVSTDPDDGGITFEENKSALTRMIADIERDMEDGVVEKKDGYARIVDIRTKLNDKFRVEEADRNRLVVVERKFDFVCPHTRRECYQLDRETAKARFGLTERNDTYGETE